MQPDSARWYALSIRSRFEKKADGLLKSKGVDSFLPLIEEIHQWKDRKKRVLEPLFRGYLFVHVDLRNVLPVLETPGVVKIVRVGERICPIPDDQIDSVKIAVAKPALVRREPSVVPGYRVKVTSGPFEGLQGTVVQLRGATRVLVSVDAIPHALSVEVSPEAISKV